MSPPPVSLCFELYPPIVLVWIHSPLSQADQGQGWVRGVCLRGDLRGHQERRVGREGASAWCFLGPMTTAGARGDRGSPLGLSQLLSQGAGMLPTNSPWLRTAPKDSGSWQFWPACLRSGRACARSRERSHERLQAPEEATALSGTTPAEAGHQRRCYIPCPELRNPWSPRSHPPSPTPAVSC